MHVDARLSPAIDAVGAWYSIPQEIPTMLVCKHFNGFHFLNINKQLEKYPCQHPNKNHDSHFGTVLWTFNMCRQLATVVI